MHDRDDLFCYYTTILCNTNFCLVCKVYDLYVSAFVLYDIPQPHILNKLVKDYRQMLPHEHKKELFYNY